MTTSQKPTLRALLVGINAYPDPVTPLDGCLEDVQKMKKYLETLSNSYEVHIQTLTDDQATKSEIISSLTTTLKATTATDCFLFYFSGHGTREEAAPIFWTMESDKQLECIVCYDGVQKQEHRIITQLIADKEIRHLLAAYGHPEAHNVLIFDCCHSGSNTRDSKVGPQGSILLARKFENQSRMSQAFPARTWDQFIFGNQIEKSILTLENVLEHFPEGNHIHLSACQNDESAYETNGEGIFTKHLLEIVQQHTDAISYMHLQNAVRNRLRNVYKQTPTVYSATSSASLFQNFLGTAMAKDQSTATMTYNDTLGWILDMGAMQGIQPESTITLSDAHVTPPIALQIKNILPAHAIIEVADPSSITLNTSITYTPQIGGIYRHHMCLHLDSSLDTENMVGIINTAIEKQSNLAQVATQETSLYTLFQENNALCIARSTMPEVPITTPLHKSEIASSLPNLLKQLSHYQFVKHLDNPSALIIDPKAIDIQLRYGHDTKEAIPIVKNDARITYHPQGESWGGSIQIKLRNMSHQKLFCSLSYLSFNHGIYTHLLKSGVQNLEPRQEVWALDGAPIELTLEKEITAYNYPESTSYLKLIISTEDFSSQLATMGLEDLPSPIVAVNRDRGLKTDASFDLYHDWTTRLITLRMPNPEK